MEVQTEQYLLESPKENETEAGAVSWPEELGGEPEPSDDAEKVTPDRLYDLFLSQDERCFYSGKPLVFENVSLEHKRPLSRGGKHVMSNVVLSTQKMKGTMTSEEFIEICINITGWVAPKRVLGNQ